MQEQFLSFIWLMSVSHPRGFDRACPPTNAMCPKENEVYIACVLDSGLFKLVTPF
jgi:hypothetical protein